VGGDEGDAGVGEFGLEAGAPVARVAHQDLPATVHIGVESAIHAETWASSSLRPQ
jgi:hypothetical protein